MTPVRDDLLQSRWAIAGLCLATAAIVAVAFMVVPRLKHQGHGRFAVVDLASVVRTNQQKAVALLADKGADQVSRTAAMTQARDFGQQLDHEVRELSAECGCVLLMREAVVAGDLEDLTPALMSRLARK